MKRFKEVFQEAPPPPQDWDLDIFKQSFKKQIDYAMEMSTKIGQGSSRVAFEIPYQGRPTILKIAKNRKGLAQNEKESDWGLSDWYDITIPLIDYDQENDPPRWIHFEKASKISKPRFKQLTGMDFDDFGNVLKQMETDRRNGRNNFVNYLSHIDEETLENIRENEVYQEAERLMADFDLIGHDLARINNWGEYKGSPVLIDMGFDSQVYDLYYKKH